MQYVLKNAILHSMTFPDRDPILAREQILAFAPFTRTFLGANSPDQDLGTFFESLSKESIDADQRLEAKFGSDTLQNLIYAPQVVVLREQNFPSRGSGLEETSSIVKSLIRVGFELQNKENIDLMLVDIIKACKNIGFIGTVNEEAETIVDSVLGLLKVGAYLRLVPPIENGETVQDPNIFRNFVNGIDDTGE